MRQLIYKTFIEHPDTVDETYGEHFWFALKFSGTLFVAAIAALLHAFIPACCEKTASKRINELHHRMHNR